MLQHVDDMGVAATVCTVRGNVYQYFENQLHVEQSWKGSPGQEIPRDLWNAKINYLLNLLKPTGYVMHQQFNIQQLYALPTLYLCVLYLSENKQRLVPLTA